MPSVTETTVPSLRMSAETARPWMRLLISSEISAGFSCMGCSVCGWGRQVETMESVRRPRRSADERRLHLFEPGADRGVEHLVADDDAHAADQLGPHDDVQLEVAQEATLHRR